MIERAAILAAAALLAGCGDVAPANDQAQAASPAEPQGPEAVAERLVRQRLGNGDVRFEEARAFSSGAVPIVCGSYSEPGRPHQRYVAVSEIEVWIEPDMAPGEMDRAFAEFCRDGAANA